MIGVIGISLAVPLAATANDAPAGALQTTAASVNNKQWYLRLPKDEHIVYQGVVSFDESGMGTKSFLYPASNAGGLLAGVITHGLFVEAAKKDQKDKLQAAASKVLSPYKDILDNFTYRDLMLRALKKISSGDNGSLVDHSEDSVREIVVESIPVFSLTQDQKAIILDNTIILYMSGTAPVATYRHDVRVVSAIRDVADPAGFWTAGDGEKLKDESAQLVAESLDITFRDVVAATDRSSVPFRTVRYQEGGTEKIERAQVLSNDCGRLLIRTLRGAFMSVPASQGVAASATTDSCDFSATRN